MISWMFAVRTAKADRLMVGSNSRLLAKYEIQSHNENIIYDLSGGSGYGNEGYT